MRIALYQGKSWVSRVIRWLTRGRYSHAAWLLDDGTVMEAWTPGGFRHVGAGHGDIIQGLSARHTPGTVVDIYAFDPPLSDRQQIMLDILVRSDLGKAYDWRMVLKFLPLPWVNRNRQSVDELKAVFCSEEVCDRAEAVGRTLLRAKPFEIAPSQVAWATGLRFEQRVTTT